MATRVEIHTLHRYFIWQTTMRQHYFDRLVEGAPPGPKGNPDIEAFMAGSLQKARDICEESKSYLVSENFHGFSDQATTLFASADAGKSATNAGIEYLDTQYPSKLADFTTHVQDSAGYFNQGFSDLNARLNELGVARVKR